MSCLRFGPFVADPTSGELLREGSRVPLQDLPFRLLLALLERPGQVVTREELSERLWGPGTHVDAAAGLNTAVAKVREALGDTAEAPRFVETVPRRGYRFVGAVEPWPTPAGPPRAAGEGRRARTLSIAAVGLLVALAAVGWWRSARTVEHRVAVVLFDDETELPEGGRRAQGLTDATVERLTREDDLAVIGNAAVLRTARPFRDLLLIRDALAAELIVVGQLQRLDDGTVVRAHLIRGADQVHVWFDSIPSTAGGEAAFQREVASRICAAVRAELDGRPRGRPTGAP